MRLTKQQLRRIIREEEVRQLEMHGDTSVVHDAMEDSGGLTVHEFDPEHWDIVSNPEFGDAPCPHGVAAAIEGSGASADDILDWIHALTTDLVGGGTPEVEEEFSFTGDVAELPGEEAFGIGYEAGSLELA